MAPGRASGILVHEMVILTHISTPNVSRGEV
jgi:hypothetical protein